jgi:hypothetical protein
MSITPYPTSSPASSGQVVLGRRSLVWPDGRCAGIRVTAMHRHHPRGGVYDRPSDWIAQAGKTIAWGRTRRAAIAALLDIACRREFDAVVDGGTVTPHTVENIVRWWDAIASTDEQLRLMHLIGLAWTDTIGLLPGQDSTAAQR